MKNNTIKINKPFLIKATENGPTYIQLNSFFNTREIYKV